MNLMIKKLFFLTSMLIIISCSNENSYDDSYEEFVESIDSNPMMEGAVWLEQSQFFDDSKYDKTILIFGYYDDMENCEIIRKAMEEVQPKLKYRCRYAK